MAVLADREAGETLSKTRRVVPSAAAVGLIVIALAVSACASSTPGPAPTVTTTSTLPALPSPTRDLDSPIDRLDAYSLCVAKLWRSGANQPEHYVTPYGGAIIERLDDLGWYVAFERKDPSPDAGLGPGLPAQSWGRCALSGTIGAVNWLAAGYCTGEQPVDDKTDLAAIEPYLETDPRASVCPTGE